MMRAGVPLIDRLLDDARRLILSTPPAALQVWEKETRRSDGTVDRSLVTSLDLAVQDTLVTKLRGLLGDDIGVYAEELGDDDPAALQQPTCVVLDPVDCTGYLIRGGPPLYSVNLAVITEGRVVGGVDFPALGWRFLVGPDGLRFNGRDLRPTPEWAGSVTVAVRPQDAGRIPARLRDGRRVLTIPQGGAAAALAWVALGVAQAAVIAPSPDRGYALWDHLPMTEGMGHLGVGVRGWASDDEDLAALRPAVWSGGMIAGTPEVRALLRARVAA